MQLLCYRCTLEETKRTGRIVQGSGPGLQGDLSRSVSTQRLTTISGWGAFYTLELAGNRMRGDVTSLRVTSGSKPDRLVAGKRADTAL